MKEYSVLNLKVHAYDMTELVNYLESDFHNKKKVFSVNPEIAYTSLNNKKIKNIINNGDVNIADGIGIVKAIKYRYKEVVSRVTGIDLVTEILSSDLGNIKIFLYGSKPGVANDAMNRLNDLYGCNIVKTYNGYETDQSKVVDSINESGAEIVFVGLGSPLQEYFVHNNFDMLVNVKLIMVVGGSFDVLSGNIRRAPKVFMKLNIEWFYRLLTNPSRIFRQVNLLKFVFEVYKRGKYDKKN